MRRREFLAAAAGAAAVSALPYGAAAAPARRPNVLLVLTDDQGWGDIRSHGNDLIDTPVADKLAEDGARFDRFYVCPLCAPTRSSLLTGRYHLRCGVSGVTKGLEIMRSDEVTIADAFRAAGYATGCFGKWHNGSHYPYHPNGRGFDEFFGFCAGHWNNYFDTTLEHNGEPVQTKGFITDVLTDAALAFIEVNRSRPFFCYIPYNAPHGPFQAPDRLFDKYKARGVNDKDAAIYAMCENIDDNVGRLLKKLDDAGLANDIIVLFITDNGPNSGRWNGDMRGAKGSPHEGGVRVPCFIRWPGHVQPGTTVRPIAAQIDLLPTLVEMCGIPMPKTLPLDGVSVASLLVGPPNPPILGGAAPSGASGWPDRKLYTHQGGKGSVRTQRYRLVREGKGTQLYDMAADPEEKHDIAAQQPQVVAELGGAYDAWLADATKKGLTPPPIQLGHPQSKRVTMLAPEATFKGGVGFQGPQGWANDWLTNWQDTEDRIGWEVDVVRPGRYEVTLFYTCPEGQTGSRVRVDIGGKSAEATLERAHDPAPLPSPDRVPRIEVYEKVWAPLTLGTVDLAPGRTRLELRALTVPGKTVMDLKRVEVRQVD